MRAKRWRWRRLAVGICLAPTALAAPPSAKPLDAEVAALRTDLKQARACSPKSQGGAVEFCTGMRFDAPELKALLALDRDACRKRIGEAGFRVLQDNQEGHVPTAEWQAFVASTKRALTFPDLRVVAMKAQGSAIDCLHELLHVYQWTRPSASRLAPAARKKRMDGLLAALEPRLARVERLEKEGQAARAKEEAARVQPVLDALSSYQELSDSLDEIEIHAFVYRQCQSQALHCATEDEEIALANLQKRKEFLPTALAAEVDAEVKKRTQAKFALEARRAVQAWRELSEDETKQVSRLLAMEWDELLEFLRERKVRVLGIASPSVSPEKVKQVFPRFGMTPEAFAKLGRPAAQELVAIGESKLLAGNAMGKFTCAFAEPTIMLSSFSTRGTLVHEFLHYLQSRKNPEYCPAISRQPKLAELFGRGELDRATYESTVLFYQATNALAEREVYRLLARQKDRLETLEISNNDEMQGKYEQLLR